MNFRTQVTNYGDQDSLQTLGVVLDENVSPGGAIDDALDDLLDELG